MAMSVAEAARLRAVEEALARLKAEVERMKAEQPEPGLLDKVLKRKPK